MGARAGEHEWGSAGRATGVSQRERQQEGSEQLEKGREAAGVFWEQ